MHIIKQLRRKKNINQTQLADEIGVSLRTVQLYEKKGANIPIKNLSKIASFFDLTIAELYIQEVNESEATYAHRKPFTHHGNICYALEHGKYLVKAPLHLIENHKDYVSSLGPNSKNASYLEVGFILDFLEEGRYRAFEISGDSMNDQSIEAIPNKAIVLGFQMDKKLLVQKEGVKKGSWILVLKNRIICKQVTGIDSKSSMITCHNLNPSPEFQDFELNLEDILEAYQVVKKQF
nr:helix-turn-helix transcriptional regulator [Allomuricauda sp.]